MKTYKVISPFLVFSVKGDNGKPKEYTAKKGDKIELPENDISVRAMVARKQLQEVKADTTGKTPKTKAAE